jgi:HAD superfamily hydrolase (TIGR01509 family)
VEDTVDLYLFDFDKTLYAYDSQKRLPAQSRLSGVSQYHLAKTWWAAGYEVRAELGEWATSAEYLDEFAEITGARLSLDQWCEARHEASTPNVGVVAALRRASALGTVSLFSNNPPPFVVTLPRMAPDVAEILGPNVLVSCQIGIRKPDPEAFHRALAHYGVGAEDAYFVDDSAANVAGAASIGITTFHYRSADDVPALNAGIEAFARRNV